MRLFLTESLVDGERSQSKSFSSCARIGRIFSFSASSPLRFNSSTSSSNSCFIKIIFRLIRNIRKCELLRHGSDKTLQVGYANHFYRSAHKFEQICRHRLRRQNVGYSNFSQPLSHLSFCVLLQYQVERRRVVTQLGKLDFALRGQICHCEHFHPEVAAHADSEQLLGKECRSEERFSRNAETDLVCRLL